MKNKHEKNNGIAEHQLMILNVALNMLMEISQKLKEATTVPDDEKVSKMNEVLVGALAKVLMMLDSSMSYEELGTMSGQGQNQGAVPQHNQTLADIAGAPYARAGITGTSIVNKGAIVAMCKAHPKGNKSVVMCDSDVHISIVDGICETGQDVIPLNRDYDENLGVSKVLDDLKIAQMLKKHPETDILVITSPDYNGNYADIKSIAATCQEHDVFLYVDSAWGVGAFLGKEGFPDHPVSLGAHAASFSLHKKSAGLSMYCCFLTSVSDIALEFDRFLENSTSTSPSYLLLGLSEMLLMESVREDGDYYETWEKLPQISRKIRKAIRNMHPDLHLVTAEDAKAKVQDPTHITLSLKKMGISGFELKQEIETNFPILLEKATADTLMFIVGGNFIDNAIRRNFLDALEAALNRLMERKNEGSSQQVWPPFPSLEGADLPLTFREAVYAPYEEVPLAESQFRVAIDLLAPYPPGVGCILPGLRIDQARIDYLFAINNAGGRVRGSIDMNADTPMIRVVKSDYFNSNNGV